MSIAVTNFPGANDTLATLGRRYNDIAGSLSGTLNGAFNIAATTFTLNSVPATVHATDGGIVTIDSEIVAYSSRSGSTFTVQASPAGRGFEGTTEKWITRRALALGLMMRRAL